MAAGGLVKRLLGTTVATGAGFAWGHAAGPIVRAPLRLLAQEANEQWPFELLAPEQAAAAEQLGEFTTAEARAEALRSGLNRSRTDVIRALAGQPPGFAQLAALRNRDAISDAEFDRGLAQLGIRKEWRDEVKALRYQLPSVQELATMAVQGVLEVGDARQLAADVGANTATFDRYYRIAGEPPGAQQLLELWNRNAIGEDDVDRGLRQSRLKPEWIGPVKALRRYLVPVSDLVRMAVREVFDPEQRRQLDLDADYPAALTGEAHRLGLAEEDARRYWAAHWDLPSYTQAAEMLHRRLITREQFDGLLRALDYAPTWRDRLARLAERLPPISDMIRFAVREVYDPEQRRQLDLDADYPAAFTAEAELHGMSEERARQYWAAHWKLPSATQGYTMLHRGEIDDQQLAGLLRALDYPAVWRDRLQSIAYLTPGRIDLRRMLAAGIITREQAVDGYMHLGYRRPVAEQLVQLALAPPGSTAKELTATQLADEFEGYYLSESDYRERLAALGFAAADVDRYVALGDARRVKRARDATIARIRASYVGHKLGRAETEAALRKAKVPAKALELLLTEWDTAKEANVSTLTQAQVVKAYKNSRMTRAQAIDALMDRGFSEPDANTRIDLETKPETQPPATPTA